VTGFLANRPGADAFRAGMPTTATILLLTALQSGDPPPLRAAAEEKPAPEEIGADLAWRMRTAADSGSIELQPEIERVISRSGAIVAQLHGESMPGPADSIGARWLATGWAALDAALVLGLVVPPEVVEPWWDARFEGRSAALLLATRAPDRFADALLARVDERWTTKEWRVWCRTIADSRRADAGARLLALVELPIEVTVHVGERVDMRRSRSTVRGREFLPVPDGFPPTRLWSFGVGERGLVKLRSDLVRQGAGCHGERPRLPGDGGRKVIRLSSTADVVSFRASSLLEAVGADPELVRGPLRRDIDFIDAASFTAERDAMARADASRWQDLLATLAAAGRLSPDDVARLAPPFRYRYQARNSAASLDELLGKGARR
jgi:hypothetical protein